MSLITAVPCHRLPIARLAAVIGAQRYARLRAGAAELRETLAGRIIWNVNSTASGGGVAEMLQTMVGYVDDLDIAVRWVRKHPQPADLPIAA